MRVRWFVWRVRQPMLHVQSGLRTFEYDVTAHAGQYTRHSLALKITYVYLGLIRGGGSFDISSASSFKIVCRLTTSF
jgi:hypothetical protein